MMGRATFLVGWLGAMVAGGCASLAGVDGDYVYDPAGEGGGSGAAGPGVGGSGAAGSGAGGFTPIGDVDKVDLVFMLDNSRSMADKQNVLVLTVPELVNGLVNPRCVDENGDPAPMQPAGPSDVCPVAGTTREFEPVVDIHIGILSSSIGSSGADSCPDQENNTCGPDPNFCNNDKGHLVTRQSQCGGGDVTTYQGKGFLAWDPKQKLVPPGEDKPGSLTASLSEMVTGMGQIGCGYESQLESWYRFLVDPEPYEKISVIGGEATPEGIDQVLLAQRRDFLRPDSLLAIIMLTDENDCSIKESGQFYFVRQLKNANGTPFQLPRARSECAADPNDPCCLSCGQSPGVCPADPTCFDMNNNVKALTTMEDQSNLRCYDQKRRFGIDFLNPIDRYVKALTSKLIPNRAGELVPNPIFSDLNLNDDISSVRDNGLVFLTGIVGVPWQDIARDPYDLKKGFKSPDEMLEKNMNGKDTWEVVVGDPPSYVPPADPHMIESIAPRSGVNPITNEPITAPLGMPNNINGTEWTIKANDDLQYACIFPLPQPRDCGDPGILSCDCKDSDNDSPLCEPDPSDPTKRTYQTRAKAYPGIRELQVLRSLSGQGITASVCPAQLTDSTSLDFGYRPAFSAMIEQIRSRLKASEK
jgi:hypothetical protein